MGASSIAAQFWILLDVSLSLQALLVGLADCLPGIWAVEASALRVRFVNPAFMVWVEGFLVMVGSLLYIYSNISYSNC